MLSDPSVLSNPSVFSNPSSSEFSVGWLIIVCAVSSGHICHTISQKLITDREIAVLAMPLLLTTAKMFRPICATGRNHLRRRRIALALPRASLMGNPPTRMPSLISKTSKCMMESSHGNNPDDYSAGKVVTVRWNRAAINYKRTSRREPLTFYIACSETKIPFPWHPGVHINSKEHEHIFTHKYR